MLSWSSLALALSFLWPGLLFAASSTTLRSVEDLQVIGKAMVSLNVGRSQRFVTIYPEEGRMHIAMRIDVDVSAIVMSYHRHSRVDAWYDKRGMTSFSCEIMENGRQTILSGKRERILRDREVMHLYGTIKGRPIDKTYPTHLYTVTSVENYPPLANAARQEESFRVLDLFSGDILLVDITPYGATACPNKISGTCQKLLRKSATLNGTFIYSEDGLMIEAQGEDEQGKFQLKMADPGLSTLTSDVVEKAAPEPPENENTETAGQVFGKKLLESFFSTPEEKAEPKAEPAAPPSAQP